MYWQKHCAESPEFTPGNVMRAMCPKLSPAEAAAYDGAVSGRALPRGRAPLPDARADPARRPRDPRQPARVADALARFAKPFLTAFTDSDPVTRGHDVRFREEIPGAQGQPHTTIAGAGHFVQEDAGETLAKITLDFIERARSLRSAVAILPPPDNDYRGSRLAVWFLWFQIAVNAFRGWVHVFWSDSGAGEHRGYRPRRATARAVMSLLAAVGVDQLAWGVIELGAVTRYRRWIPTVLAVPAREAGGRGLAALGVEAARRRGAGQVRRARGRAARRARALALAARARAETRMRCLA